MSRVTNARARWMAEASRLITEARPDLAGRLNWNTLAYFHGIGLYPDLAAARYLRGDPQPVDNTGPRD